MANSAFSSFRLEGLDDIRNVIKTLPKELQEKIMAVAVTRAAKPLVDTAKMFARRSERTGALKESIGAVVKKGKRGGVYAVVGPRRGYYKGGKKLGKGDDKSGADMPANYAHLVEFGHHVVAPIKNTSRRKKTAKTAKSGATFVAAKPFMRPALLAAGDAIATEMANGVADGIERSLKRIVKNPAARG